MLDFMERAKGFEPSTPTLARFDQRKCRSAEAHVAEARAPRSAGIVGLAPWGAIVIFTRPVIRYSDVSFAGSDDPSHDGPDRLWWPGNKAEDANRRWLTTDQPSAITCSRSSSIATAPSPLPKEPM